MLDGISKIKTEIKTEFTSQGQDRQSPPYFPSKIQTKKKKLQKSEHDDVKFSPAANYLNKFNWVLKKLSIIENDSIIINFIISNFEFSAEINLKKFIYDDRQIYHVVSERTYNSQKYKLLLTFSVKKSKIEFNDESENIRFDALDSVFKRAVALEIQDRITKYETDKLQELLDGIDKRLYKELDFVNDIIYTLLSRINILNLSPEIHFNDDLLDTVIIDKIIKI